MRRHGATVNGRQNVPPEYRSWTSLKSRCLNPAVPEYPYYGGRGITVCARWQGPEGYVNFLADVGRRPSPRHSIDRFPDKDGNYEPGNVRWATRSQQMRNMRRNVVVTFAGKTATAAEWGQITGIDGHILRRRLRDGWSPERALTVGASPTFLASLTGEPEGGLEVTLPADGPCTIARVMDS